MPATSEARQAVTERPRGPAPAAGVGSLLIVLGIVAAALGLAAGIERLWPAGAASRFAWLAVTNLALLAFVAIVEHFILASRQRSLAIVLAALARRRAVWWIVAAGFAGSLALVWALRAFPNSGDEYDYLFQAKTFLAGRLWNPAPPQHEFFAFYWQVFHDGKWTTLYPPGWPLLLAAAMGARLPPWLVSPLAGAALLWLLFALGRRRAGPLGGGLAVLLVAASPFFLFNAASYFMHVPAAAAGLAFCWAGLEFLDRPGASRAALAGFALGILGLIRPEDVPLFALPFAGEFLWRGRWPHYRLVPVLLAAGLPFLVALLFYYRAITGSPLPDPATFYPEVKFGLYSVGVSGKLFTPLDQLAYLGQRLLLLMRWSSLFAVVAYAAAFAWQARRRRLRFVDFVFPAFLLGYMLEPGWGGNQYGPRYYFEGYPLFVLTVVPPLVRLLQEAGRRRAWLAGNLVLAHAAVGLVLTAHFAYLFRDAVDQRMDLYDQVRARGLDNAVVVIGSSTGGRLPMEPKDLTRNGIALDGKVIYALDLPGRLDALRRLFPARRFYLYHRQADAPRGSLRPLGRSGAAPAREFGGTASPRHRKI